MIHIRPLRLGFDQLILGGSTQMMPSQIFAETSSIQKLVLLVLICLSDQKEMHRNDGDIFPTMAGSGVYINPSFSIDFTQLSHHLGQRYLLIGFAEEYSQYLKNEKDLHGHQLKNLGYVFGDRLKDSLHPILFR